MADIRVKLRVTGRVQGVYFRASTLAQAQALGLTGWVRNTADGAVELEAEGPSERVERLVEWAREGPAAARVDEVAVTAIPTVGTERGFRVRP